MGMMNRIKRGSVDVFDGVNIHGFLSSFIIMYDMGRLGY